MNQKSEKSYDDIIHLPHHVSTNHPQMSIHDRAAQFSAFAALTGHDEQIKETARLTDHRIELDENSKRKLDERLQLLKQALKSRPFVTFTYFLPDGRKEGGAYTTASGNIKKINEYERIIYLEDGKEIEIDEILSVEGELFKLHE